MKMGFIPERIGGIKYIFMEDDTKMMFYACAIYWAGFAARFKSVDVL